MMPSWHHNDTFDFFQISAKNLAVCRAKGIEKKGERNKQRQPTKIRNDFAFVDLKTQNEIRVNGI